MQNGEMRKMRPVKLLLQLIFVATIIAVCFFLFHPSPTRRINSSKDHLLQMLAVATHKRTVDHGLPSEEEAELSRDDMNAAGSEKKETLTDVRSDDCRQRHYRHTVRNPVSLVVDLPADVTLEQLKTTVGSLLAGSEQLVDQVILVGVNGPTSDVADQAENYLATLNVENTLLVRQAGSSQIESRTVGNNHAKHEIVVFSDCQVVGTVGWLKPLIYALMSNQQSIVVPHYDDATNPSVYVATPERLLSEYTWPLTMRMFENTSSTLTSKGLYRSPTVRGNIFAVRRYFFTAIGAYDVQLKSDSAAGHLELSLRTWLCGGFVYVHPCSHAGVRDLFQPVKVTEETSVRHIKFLWFEARKNIMMTSMNLAWEPKSTDEETKGRRTDCKQIDWFFNEVAATPVPSGETSNYGQLQAKTGRCAHAHEDDRLDLGQCWPGTPHSLTSMVFELDVSGRLMSMGKCLTVHLSSYVLVNACFQPMRVQQYWRYINGHLVNPWSDLCLMHVTDPENGSAQKRQVIMAQNCTADLYTGKVFDGGLSEFIQWQFVNP